MHRPRPVTLCVLAALGLATAGCGSSSAKATTSVSSSTTRGTIATVTSVSTTTVPPPMVKAPKHIAPIPVADRSPAGVSGKAPTVVVPPGPPPTVLEDADLIAGQGATAKAGDSVTVQYVLDSYSTRKLVQSSWTSQPFTFTLGVHDVVLGWDEGVQGMKVGGRRELIIPPALGYGNQSPGQGIAANDTLVFVIDLLKVSPPASGA